MLLNRMKRILYIGSVYLIKLNFKKPVFELDKNFFIRFEVELVKRVGGCLVCKLINQD